jgi:hypothetical protein
MIHARGRTDKQSSATRTAVLAGGGDDIVKDGEMPNRMSAEKARAPQLANSATLTARRACYRRQQAG